jgi:aryl-alcohol dehydrogenase-like predicted oxidoreductase
MNYNPWAIGADWEFGWGAQDDAQSVAAIHRALDGFRTAHRRDDPRTHCCAGQNRLRTRNEQFKEPKLSENLKLVERLRAVGARHGRSPGETAIAWTLRHPAVTGAIVGARNSKQVDGIIGATDFRLTSSEIAEVEGQGI